MPEFCWYDHSRFREILFYLINNSLASFIISAASIDILKSVFVLLTRGVTAFFMSLSGGTLSYIIMLLLYRKTEASLMLISIAGALAHNAGQLCAASAIMKTAAVFGYSPVMIISGCIAGAVTGAVLKLLLNAMQRDNNKQGGN